MPTYSFECNKCQNAWEELADFDKTGKYKGVSCPKCKSKSKTKLLTSCRIQFTNPVGTDVWNSESAGHDYRHKFNMDRPGGVKDQRSFAEQNSHMGSQPYAHMNDLDADTNWGEVK